MPFQTHPYAPFVHLVEKPARYLGGEFGARKKPWSSVDARVCLAFPDVYDIGMSHLGFKILYRVLNDHPRTLAERAYAPWLDMERELRARGLPLVSLESATPLSQFDVVGFSLQFELTYTNVLAMLDLGGIALRSVDRDEDAPLIVAGGPTATHPEPVAPFFDAVVIGDGEEVATELALRWVELRGAGIARAERLREIARIRGVYVPSLYSTRIDRGTGLEVIDSALAETARLPVARAFVADLNRFPFPDDGPVGGPEAVFDRLSVEIARGCTEGCRFCQAGMIYRPVRERSPSTVLETALSAVKKSGYDEVSLSSLSTADYSAIAPLVERMAAALAPERVSLGVSSLRAYGLDEAVLDDMERVRAVGVTFAPEAGTERLRDAINKNVTEEQLMTTAERIFSRGWSSMKLYFMAGLPTEEEADVRAIVDLAARVRDVGRRVKRAMGAGGPPSVTVSVSTHVPKPHTPFQWCAMDGVETLRQKHALLRDEARKSRVELRVHDVDTSWLEAIFARGDRQLADVLEHAFRSGARFDSWEDQKHKARWTDAFAACAVDPARYTGAIPVTARLPWDHIDVGLADGFLAREYGKALRNRPSPPCGKAVGMYVHHTNVADAEADERKLVCYDCGVACDLDALRAERIVALERLGATERRERLPPSPRSPEKPLASFVQGAARRYRFRFTKLGPSAFLSHLDLIRVLGRAFRRVGLPVFYSRGFHPKPEMIFAPALSLGVASLAEYVDVKITSDFEPLAYLDELSASGPDGFDFTGARPLGPSDPGVNGVIDTARYVVAFDRAVLPSGGNAWLRDRVEAMMAATELPIVRTVGRASKHLDVRAFLRALSVGDDVTRSALDAAGFVGELAFVQADVELGNRGSVKITEIARVLFGEAPLPPHQTLRTGLGLLVGGSLRTPLEPSAAAPGQSEPEAPPIEP